MLPEISLKSTSSSSSSLFSYSSSYSSSEERLRSLSQEWTRIFGIESLLIGSTQIIYFSRSLICSES